MATQFDRHLLEIRELQAQLRSGEPVTDIDLDHILTRLGFLREQIDLARKTVEAARKGALRELQSIQEELDRERSP